MSENKGKPIVKNNIQIYSDRFRDGICSSIYLSNDENTAYVMHYHDYYEIVIYFGNEPGQYIQEGKEYTLHCGDIVFCNIFKNHLFNFFPGKGHERMSFGLSSDTVFNFSSSDTHLLELFDETSPYYPVFHADFLQFVKYTDLISKLYHTKLSHSQKSFQKGLLCQICAYLYDDCFRGAAIDSKWYNQTRLISDIITFVDQHFTEPISIEKVSSHFNYSSAYLSRIFHNYTGESFGHYILNKRIALAAFLLAEDTPITEIARNVGFENYSYFYKSFKKVRGIGPSEYRELVKKSKSMNPNEDGR